MNGCYYLLFMDILFLVKVFSFEILRLCSLKLYLDQANQIMAKKNKVIERKLPTLAKLVANYFTA